jgi:hypothetical protein
MPVIGETCQKCYRSSYPQPFVWQACEGCGKERWVEMRYGKPLHHKCVRCATKRWRNYPVKVNACE